MMGTNRIAEIIHFVRSEYQTDIIGLEMINSGYSTKIWREIFDIFEID